MVGAGLLWGTAGLWVHWLEDGGLPALQVVALRILASAAGFLLAAALVPGMRRGLRIRWRDAWCFAGTGVVSIVMFSWCYFETIRAAGIAPAVLLLYTSPIFVMLLSLACFRERMTWRKTLACALAVGGVALASGLGRDGLSIRPAALLTGLLSGLGYALYSIFGRAAINRGYSSWTIVFWTFLFAAAVLLPVAAPADWLSAARSSPGAALSAVALPLLATLCPYLLYTRGLESTPNGRAAILAFAEPLAASLLGLLVLRQRLTLPLLAGMALVFAALLLSLSPRNEP